MISALVSSYWIDNEKPEILKRCLDSIVGADEILSLVTHKKSPLGFSESWNRLATLAKGDYLVFIGDNNTQVSGDLSQLCIKDTVTSPLINNQAQDFWGMVFCMPRNIYEKTGLYDPIFNSGSHWEDTDLKKRLDLAGIACLSVKSINFIRPQGGRTIEADPNAQEKKAINGHVFRQKWNL